MTKASEDDRDKAGTAGLSIDDVQSQLKFFSAEMATLLAARQTEAEALEDRNRELEIAKSESSKAGGSTRTQRDATVELAVTCKTRGGDEFSGRNWPEALTKIILLGINFCVQVADIVNATPTKTPQNYYILQFHG